MTYDEMLAAERLDQFWDGLVAGRRTSDANGTLPTEHAYLAQRVQATQPPTPSAAARRRILQLAIARSTEEATPMTDWQASSPPFSAQVVFEPERRRVRAWLPTLEFAAAALLILIVVGGLFVGDRLLPNDERDHFAAVASPADAKVKPDPGSWSGGLWIPEQTDGEIELSLWRLTVDPGTTWQTPEGMTSSLYVHDGRLEVRGDYERQRLGRREGLDSYWPAELTNAGFEPAVVDLLLVSSSAIEVAFPDGISAVELGGSRVPDMPSGPTGVDYTYTTVEVSEGEPVEGDTGRDGVALIFVEDGSARVFQQTGTVVSRTRAANGQLSPPEPAMHEAGVALQEGGDSVVIHTGASFHLYAEPRETEATITWLAIEPNSAGSQAYAGGKSEPPPRPAATSAALTSPSPNECTVEPRTIESLEQLFLSPVPETHEAMRLQPGDGEPADDETVAGVTTTMREYSACYNADDHLRIAALYTDDAMRPNLTADEIEDARRGDPLTVNYQYVMPAVWDVRVQPDGSVTAKVFFYDVEERVLVVFVRQGDRWLIDFWNDQVTIEDPPQATPQP